ncbi:MAG: hypothetical protein AAFR81_29935 [Chloroflexota bacterium]
MVNPFYIDTTGATVLRINQEQGAGSQLQAGARAELIDSPVTKALSTFGGRIAAQTMQYMFKGRMDGLMNYAAFRPRAMQYVLESLLGEPSEATNKRVLDPAGGYSPVFYWLAQKYNNVSFIEVDIPKVIENKRRMLYPLGIPRNLRLRDGDLSNQHLHEIVTRRSDIMLTIGAYVTKAKFRELLDYLPHVMKSGAYLVASFPYLPGIDNFQQNSMIFSKIVTEPRGTIANEKVLHTIFRDTPFDLIESVCLSELAREREMPIPADIEIFAVAKLR